LGCRGVILWRTYVDAEVRIKCPRLLLRHCASRKRRWPRFSSGPWADCWLCCWSPQARACCGCARLPGPRCRAGWRSASHRLSAPVIVRRDAHGVPTSRLRVRMICSCSGIRDRAGQAVADGRLPSQRQRRVAEIMGSSMVRHDKTQRVLQFGIQPGASTRICPRRPRAAGRLRTRREPVHRPAPRFERRGLAAAGVPPAPLSPQPWSGVDSVSIGMMMVDMLDTHWYAKLSREVVPRGCATRSWSPICIRLARGATIRPPDMWWIGASRIPRPPGQGRRRGRPQPGQQRFGCPRSAFGTWDTIISIRLVLEPHEDPRALRDLLGLPDCDGCAPGSNNWVIAR